MAAPQQKTPSLILDIAKVSQMLAAHDEGNQVFLRGGSLDGNLSLKIYMERKALEIAMRLSNSADYIQGIANYLYALLGDYGNKSLTLINNIALGLPVVTGPANVSIQLGAVASFTIGITSATPSTIAWFKNGVLIPGATGTTYAYTPLIGDNGALIDAEVTNSAGTTVSRLATLTVTASLVGSYFFGDIDYFSLLNIGADTIPYDGTFAIVPGQPLVVPFPIGAANNKFIGVRYPATESDKIAWQDSVTNYGTIPDGVIRAIISFGGNKYIISKNAMSLDAVDPTVTFT